LKTKTAIDIRANRAHTQNGRVEIFCERHLYIGDRFASFGISNDAFDGSQRRGILRSSRKKSEHHPTNIDVFMVDKEMIAQTNTATFITCWHESFELIKIGAAARRMNADSNEGAM
jgi:hypothetical protein